MLPTEKCCNGCELEVGLSHTSFLHQTALFILHVRGMDERWWVPLSGSLREVGVGECEECGTVGVFKEVGKRGTRKGRAVLCARSCMEKYLLRGSLSFFLPHVR